MIVIEFRFPAGRYHASAWGTHVNEGVCEWPPSPWRLCRALWATWFNKHSHSVPKEDMKILIEKLVDAPLPRYGIPNAVPAHTRHYMPSIEGKKASKTKIFDTFVQLNKEGDDPLFVLWQVEIDAEHRKTLNALLQSVNYLGRAESLVEARLLPLSESPPLVNTMPLHTETEHDADYEPIKLLAPIPQAEFRLWRADMLTEFDRKTGKGKKAVLPERINDCLTLDTAEWKNATWSQPPGSRWVIYRRPLCSIKRIGKKNFRSRSESYPTIARFSIESDVCPNITQALSLGERFHRALVKISNGADVFSGCDKDGKPLKGNHHASFLPQMSGIRGEVKSFTIYAPSGFRNHERIALEKLRRVWNYDSLTLRISLISTGNINQSANSSDSIFGSSKVWTSITPFVSTRHPKTRKNGEPKLDTEGIEIGSAKHDLLRLLCLNRPDLPTPEVKEIRGPILDRRLVWIDYQTRRKHGKGAFSGNLATGFKLTFPEPVNGPLSFGYGAHFGLGLFVPLKD